MSSDADRPTTCKWCGTALGILPAARVTLCTRCDWPENGEAPLVFERVVFEWKDGK